MNYDFKDILGGLCLFALLNSCNAQDKKSDKVGDSEAIISIVNDSTAESKVLYSNGKIKECSHYNKSQELNGKFEQWYDNGNKESSWNYFRNKLHGTQYSWDENGNLTNQSNYFMGQKDGYQINFRNKDTLSVENYVRGKLIGKSVPKDYYTPPAIMLDNLLSQGLDSIVAVKMLRDNLSGYIVKKNGKAVFIEDTSVAGFIGDVINQTNAIEKTKFNTPITHEYLLSKGLTDDQIKYLVKKGYIKLSDKNQSKM